MNGDLMRSKAGKRVAMALLPHRWPQYPNLLEKNITSNLERLGCDRNASQVVMRYIKHANGKQMNNFVARCLEPSSKK